MDLIATVVVAVQETGTGPREALPTALLFFLIGVGAFTLPILGRRIGIPAIVLEILYGLVLGPAMLGVIEIDSIDGEFIVLLAELGLFLLMFLAGFEIDFQWLERQGPGPILTGVGVYGVIVAALWFAIGMFLGGDTDQQVFLTLLISACSLGIVIPALRVTGRTRTRLGQLTVVTTVIAEFVSATAIVLFGVWVEYGFGYQLLNVPALGVLTLASLLVIRWAAWWQPRWFQRLFSGDDPDEMGIRASLALLFVFLAFSVALDVEPILGAFLAGAMFSFVFRNTHELETSLSGFAYGFFVPIFFISVGLGFPLEELTDSSVLRDAIVLVVIGIAVKVGAGLIFTLRGLGVRQAVASGVLLSGQLSVIIALAEYGVDLGLIDEALEAGAILLVGVTAVFAPILFRWLEPPAARPGREEGPRPHRDLAGAVQDEGRTALNPPRSAAP